MSGATWFHFRIIISKFSPMRVNLVSWYSPHFSLPIDFVSVTSSIDSLPRLSLATISMLTVYKLNIVFESMLFTHYQKFVAIPDRCDISLCNFCSLQLRTSTSLLITIFDWHVMPIEKNAFEYRGWVKKRGWTNLIKRELKHKRWGGLWQ